MGWRTGMAAAVLGCVSVWPPAAPAAVTRQPADPAVPVDPAPPPATDLPDGPLQIVVTAVTGLVSARNAADEPWAKVEVGQQFPEGVELRTGPKSVVKFDIPPASSITLDRLGTVKVMRAAIESGTIKTDLGMKYGRTRYDIETASRPHDVQIRSPSSVLAVRGTDVILEDTPGFPPRAVSVTGRARFTDATGLTTPIGGPDATFPSEAESGTGGAADTARQESVARSPLDLGRTTNEIALMVNIPPAAGLPPPPGGALRSVQGGTIGAPPSPPISTVPPVPEIPDNFLTGTLAFELRWTGNADLQIGVVSPLGEAISTNPSAVLTLPARAVPPVGTTSRSGGVASPNATGGPAGSFVETVTWPTAFPPGAYDYGVKYAGGQGPATYTLEAVVNGIRLDPPVAGTLTGPTANPEFVAQQVDITPVEPATAAASVRTAQRAKPPTPAVTAPKPSPTAARKRK